jgi:hypothetical protein
MNFKSTLFIGWFLLASLTHAQNFVFSGSEINEIQLADFIVKVKKLNVGVDSPDALTNMLGNPALKTRQSGLEEWKYDFLLKEAKDIENLQKIENALEERRQRRQRMSLDEMTRESRLNDDKYEKLERLKMQLDMKPPTQVSCKLKLGEDGKLSNIRVEKYMQDTTDILYVKGDSEDKNSNAKAFNGQMPLTAEPPNNPNPGQIYFNTNDKHFYGWGGASWLKLDSKP